MTGFTPGPWFYVYEGSGDHQVFTEGVEKEIANCRSGWAISDGESFEVSAANAKLIAEAPAMYEALVDAIDMKPKWIFKARAIIERIDND